MSTRTLLAIVAPLLPLSIAAAQGHVWVVLPGSQIQPVIDAASDGDTLLVKQGQYDFFFIDDKALHIVAEVGAKVEVQTPIRVENLSAGKVVTLAGLRLRDANFISGHATGLLGRNNAGALRVVECHIEGSPGFQSVEGVRLHQSADVAFTRCFVTGGWGNYAGEYGALGMTSRRSNVAFFDGAVAGGAGGDAQYWQYGQWGGKGGEAFDSPEGLLFACNSYIDGGEGGRGGDEDCDIFTHTCPGGGGAGGAGILQYSTLNPPPISRVVLLGSMVKGGAGGPGGSGFCFCGAGPSGPPGVPVLPGTGTVEELNEPTRFLMSPRLARDFTQVPLSLVGVPGDRVYLIVSTATRWVYDEALAGVALVPAARGTYIGVVPGSGTLHFSHSLGDLGPGVEARTLHLQALVFGLDLKPKLASFGVLAVVDQQF